MSHIVNGKRAAFYASWDGGAWTPYLVIEGDPHKHALDEQTINNFAFIAGSNEHLPCVIDTVNCAGGYTKAEVQDIIDSSIAASFQVAR
ncbi:MAG TPA: hypothetical protein VNF68_07200 [Candidatus Baltobacteraceae bacterium]|nr:hypothetical protein [Candidatus Baltobacteraceae bacterium]